MYGTTDERMLDSRQWIGALNRCAFDVLRARWFLTSQFTWMLQKFAERLTMSRSKMSGEARRRKILNLLRQTGFLSVSQIAEDFNVSDMTVRRDLRKLAQTGEATPVHGGVSLANPAAFRDRGIQSTDVTALIGRCAADLIESGSAVVLDAGATALEVAHSLPGDFDGFVVTPSVPVLAHLMRRDPAIHALGLGGDLVAETQALSGPTTVEGLSKIQANIAFLGAASVSARGVFVNKDSERSTKTALINSAQRVVLLAEHDQFNSSAPVLLTGLDSIDILVTDAEPPHDVREACDAAGVSIVVARRADPEV